MYDDVVMYILGGLGAEYDDDVVSLTTRGVDMSLPKVQSILQTREMCLLQASTVTGLFPSQSPQSPLNPVANTASKDSNAKGSGKYKGKNKFSGKQKVICQLCGKTNHVAAKCYKRVDSSFLGFENNQSHSTQFGSSGFPSQQAHFTQHSAYATSTPSTPSYSNYARSVYSSKFLDSSAPHDRTVHLHKVHVPDIIKNLLSISQFLRDNRDAIELHADFCVVKDLNTHKILLRGQFKDGLYQLILSHFGEDASLKSIKSRPSLVSCNSLNSVVGVSCNSVNNVVGNKVMLRHDRLGHQCDSTLSIVLRSPKIPMNKVSFEFCASCKLGKIHQMHFPPVEHHTIGVFELIHLDIWGPTSALFMYGYKYYLLIDDFTRYTWIFPITLKSEVVTIVTQFISTVERQFSGKIMAMQSDMGGEFIVLAKLCKNLGIAMRNACPHTHQQNGVVERKHQHVTEIGLTLLAKSGLHMFFWWKAFEMAVMLIKFLPSPVLKSFSPYHKLYHKSRDMFFLRVFGCECYPYLRPYNSSKLQLRSFRCVFLGYCSPHKGCKCLDGSKRMYL